MLNDGRMNAETTQLRLDSGSAFCAGSVLFVDKVFLNSKDRPPGGVEVFNLNLVSDLAALGGAVTVVAHRTWERAIGEWMGARRVEVVTPIAGGGMIGGLSALWRLRGRRFSVLLLGNIGDRLIPLVSCVRRWRLADRGALIAHREPSGKFVAALRRLPTGVLAVNGKIADHFRGKGYGRIEVGYGITGAAKFFPRESPRDEPKPHVDFCVVGRLDRKWKGADTAVEAFRRLPDAARTRCRLHLAAFERPPTFAEPGIVAYRWLPFGDVGEFLRTMDVMIVPSRDEEVMRETFSQAAVQGMLTGLPLIVSDLPVLVEKVDQGGGLVFRDVPELAQAMARLAGDDRLRRTLGAQGRATALSRYVWDTRAFAARYLLPPNR